MARKRRIELPGALYHVLTRGNQRQRVFRSKKDFARYLDLLSQYKNRYRFRLFAYALMSNHVHLLVETSQVALSKVFQGIHQSYTQYFNRTHETVGHLFQGRYKAILCDRDEYLLTLVKYIHQNPVRAKVAKTPAEYPWSSHNEYVGKKTDGSLVDTDYVLRLFSERRQAAINRYLAFMNTGPVADKKQIYGAVDQRILGDEQFVSAVKDKVPADIRGSKRQGRYTLDEIASAIEKATAVSIEQMRTQTKSRVVGKSRRMFCRIARDYSYRNYEIAKYLERDPAAVTRSLKTTDEESEEMFQLIMDTLKLKAS